MYLITFNTPNAKMKSVDSCYKEIVKNRDEAIKKFNEISKLKYKVNLYKLIKTGDHL